MTRATAVATPSHRPQNVLLGILFMCLAGSLFPVMNGLVQVMSDRFPSSQLVWARAASHAVFIVALFLPRFGTKVLHSNALGLQVLRSVCLMSSTLCFFNGVKHLPLAKASSISFMAPFFVALLSWPILRETVSLPRLAAVTVGFAGVLIVVQPGSGVFQWASLFIVGSAFFYAVYQILTRRVAPYDTAETSAIYASFCGTIVMGLYVPFVWTQPQTMTDWGLLFSLGVIGGLGHYCVAKAMSYAPANVISPFQYWQLIGAVIVGFLITGTMPEATTWLGAAVIIGAGLFIGWRETREKRGKTV